MANCEKASVKLTKNQLEKLESAAKSKTGPPTFISMKL